MYYPKIPCFSVLFCFQKAITLISQTYRTYNKHLLLKKKNIIYSGITYTQQIRNIFKQTKLLAGIRFL